MITQEILEDLIEQVNTQKFKRPACFGKWAYLVEKMQLHSQDYEREDEKITENLPAYKLIKNYRGDLDGKVLKQRVKNLKLITLPFIHMFFNNLHKVGNVDFVSNENQNVKTYLSNKTFKGMNFYNFITEYLSDISNVDANSVLVWLPSDKELREENQEPEPLPCVISSCDIIDIKEDYIIFYFGTENDKKIYLALDEKFMYRIEYDTKTKAQRKADNKGTLNNGAYVALNFGFTPFKVLGIVPVTTEKNNKELLYYKPQALDAVTTFGDDILEFMSDNKVVWKSIGNPVTAIAKQKCPVCNGKKKRTIKVKVKGHKGKVVHTENCPKCEGTGEYTYLGPDRIIKFDATKNVMEQGVNKSGFVDPIKFYTPPVPAIESQDKHIQNLLINFTYCLGILLPTSNKQETAEKAKIDRENALAFAQRQVNFLRDTFYFSYRCLTVLLDSDDEVSTDDLYVNIPEDLSLRSFDEVWEEFLLKTKETNNFSILYPIYIEAINIRYKDNPEQLFIAKFLPFYDPLFFTFNEDSLSIDTSIDDTEIQKHRLASRELSMYLLRLTDEQKTAILTDEFTKSFDKVSKDLDVIINKKINF